MKDKLITHNILKIQDTESIMHGFCFIAFIKYMHAGKTLLDYINLFSPNDYKKKDKVIYYNFIDKYDHFIYKIFINKYFIDKNQLSLKIKKLIIFQMISLKSIKSLTYFY